LSYPEWIATCIQLKNLEKYLLLLNRNLAKCKDRFELKKVNKQKFCKGMSLKTELYNLSNISGVMGSFFSIGVTNRRFVPSNTFLAIRLLVDLHVFLQDHESDVQLLPSPLYVDLLMDLLCVSEADSTFNI
jgi:hypothetical protein